MTLLRNDLRLIADMIEPDSRVLDVGCGDGALLTHLSEGKNVDARGIELSQSGVNACVSRGLSVIQGDADTDLSDYPDNAFDYVVLSQTLQATRQPDAVLNDLVRIGRHAIVSFVNSGHWRNRLTLLFKGRMPVADPDRSWYNNPDIRQCTVLDFLDLCASSGLTIEEALSVDAGGRSNPIKIDSRTANLTGLQAIFLLTRNHDISGSDAAGA